MDIGSSEAVTLEREWLEYPGLLDLPRPRLRAYRPETAIAEKVHAMVVLGVKNRRMRDFLRIHTVAEHLFIQRSNARSIRTTFERRGTAIPTVTPLALTPAQVEGKSAR